MSDEQDAAEREAAEIEAAGAFAQQVAPHPQAGAAVDGDIDTGGANEQQDARRLHGLTSEGGGEGPDPLRGQQDLGSANGDAGL
jgi:hypothetical protein